MAITQAKLVPGVGDKQKFYAPIFSQSSSSMNVSLSVQAISEYVGNVNITIVYWEDGQKKIVKDFLAGTAATPINFTINTPTSLPPFIMYLDADSLTAVDIEVIYDLPLTVGPVTPNDEEIMSPSGTALPLINLNEMYIQTENAEVIKDIKDLFTTAEVTRSPLVVDLDGDGVETVGVSEGVYFDHDGNGFAEKSGWVGKDDGILVRDINNNGTIDNGTELFGNNSVLSSGENALNGFEALKELDSNKDGVFNSSDEAWNTVKVWKDSNQNGIVDNSELLSLEQANIAGINLNYNEQELVDGNGNTHAQTGTIIKTDGSSGTITDVWFDADTADTIDQAEVIIPDDIKSLPDVSGFGNVHSLQAAMALDESGELLSLIHI